MTTETDKTKAHEMRTAAEHNVTDGWIIESKGMVKVQGGWVTRPDFVRE